MSNSLEELATECNFALYSGDEQRCIRVMNHLFMACHGRNGKKLLQISPDVTQPIGLAFANIAQYLDFSDHDHNSVAAENAVYCLARGIFERDNQYAAISLFTILFHEKDLLRS